MAIAGAALILTLIVRLANFSVRKDVSANVNLLLTISFIAIILSSWWLVTKGDRVEDRVLAPLILPSPAEVLQAFPKLHFEQGLMRSVVTSFCRVTEGFTLAVILAFALGVYMAAYPPVAAFFKPLALVGSYVPIISFIPLTLAWWGSGEIQKVGFLFIACFVVLLPLIIKSINDVSASFLDVARTKGASSWQLVKNVLVPVAMPSIWGHLRGIYGVGWGWIILAEVVNAQNGIGYLMSISERRGQTASIFAIIIVIVLIATLVDHLWRVAGNWLFPYKKV
jgi:NitT/TauT family transport system permease protein